MHFTGNDKPAIFEHECECMAAMALVHLVHRHGGLLRSMSAAWPIDTIEVDAWAMPQDRCIGCNVGATKPKSPGPNGCGCLTALELSHLLQVATNDIALQVASGWSMLVLPVDVGAAPITTDIRTIARLHEYTGPMPAKIEPSKDGMGATLLAKVFGFINSTSHPIGFQRDEARRKPECN
jgi:hypothetical protein